LYHGSKKTKWATHIWKSGGTNFRFTIYSHSSTNPENLAKIGLVDLEIIGLTAVVINKDETAAEHIACRCTAAGQAKLHKMVTVASRQTYKVATEDLRWPIVC